MRELERLLDLQLKTCCGGLTLSQCHLLLEIESQEETRTGQLARQLKLDKGALSRGIDTLVSLGLVRRSAHSSDRRVILLTLTREGEKACDAINAGADQDYLRIFRRIPERQREAVVRKIGLFVEAFAAHENERAARSGCCPPSRRGATRRSQAAPTR